jgi:hypothetical protein
MSFSELINRSIKSAEDSLWEPLVELFKLADDNPELQSEIESKFDEFEKLISKAPEKYLRNEINRYEIPIYYRLKLSGKKKENPMKVEINDMSKKNLVLVISGDESLIFRNNFHCKELRDFTLMTIYFGDNETNKLLLSSLSDIYSEYKGPKGFILNKLFQYQFDLIKSFDTFTIMDDDIEIDCKSFNDFLSECQKESSKLLVPSVKKHNVVHYNQIHRSEDIKVIKTDKDYYIKERYLPFDQFCMLFKSSIFEILRKFIIRDCCLALWGIEHFHSLIDSCVINTAICTHTKTLTKINEGFYKKFRINPEEELDLAKKFVLSLTEKDF